MFLALRDIDEAQAEQIEEWRFPAEPFFLPSGASGTLVRELRNYVSGTVPGRSFLISAYRGVGKTTLVRRTVAQQEREAIRAAVRALQAPAGHLGNPPVRPLLVKLHGNSLLTESYYRQEASAEAAMQQIAIALYRSFAREVSDCFARHARHVRLTAPRSRRELEDLTELAGQLTLDLDQAPDAARLRYCWDRLGCLESGVLWPGAVGRAHAQVGQKDRGVREIVAITTANQAFQVCSGAVTASQSASGSAKREQEMDSALRLDAKDAVNKLWGLAAGALTGAAVFAGSASGSAAAAAGLATGVASTMALGWSSSRAQSTQRSAEYSFIIDRSVQTLDRDLPLVIERIRQAGLAPVFLIDELDKVERPDKCIEAIIRRLKNFTTDYGFFCFLTDKGYFDFIEKRISARAYPIEHTFFSHRLLVIYRPPELGRYVRSLWATAELDVPLPANEAELGRRRSDAETAAWIVTCVALHRARLNSMDLRRELARLCDGDDRLLADPSQIVSRLEYLVPTAIQLAIEHVLRTKFRRRIEADDRFAQLAFDVLYQPSHAWEDGEDHIAVTVDAILDNLRTRRNIDPRDKEAVAAFEDTTPRPDIDSLAGALRLLMDLLTSFSSIAVAVLQEPDFATNTLVADPTALSERAKIAVLGRVLQAIPTDKPGLVAEDPGRPGIFVFRLDRFGEEKFETAGLRYERAQAGVQTLEALRAAAQYNELTLDQLCLRGVLPRATMDEARLDAAATQLRGAAGPDDPRLAGIDDLPLLIGLSSNAVTLSRPLIALSTLAHLVKQAALPFRPDVTADHGLRAIERMLGIASLSNALTLPTPGAGLASSRSPNAPLAAALTQCAGLDDGRDPANWRVAIRNERDRLRATASLEVPAALAAFTEQAWRDRVQRYLLERATPTEPPIGFADLVAAAAGLLLPSLLRPDMETMTISEWSQFCTRMRNPDAASISWGFAAGLRALNFGAGILREAAPMEPQWQAGAPPDQPGILYISPLPPELDTVPDPRHGPVVSAPEGAGENGPAVKWLIENGAVTARA